MDTDPETPLSHDRIRTLYLRARDVPCPACGYILRGLEDDRCPECGCPLQIWVTLGRTSQIQFDPQEESRRLKAYLADRDADCPRCSHGLRGHDGIQCPACGLDLSVWTLRPRGLDPRRHRGIRTSVWVLVAVLFGMAILTWAVALMAMLRS